MRRQDSNVFLVALNPNIYYEIYTVLPLFYGNYAIGYAVGWNHIGICKESAMAG